MSKNYDVYLTYASQDEGRIAEIVRRLRDVGIKCWQGNIGLLEKQESLADFFESVSQSRFFAPILSTSSIQTNLIRDALTTARLSEIESKNTFIIPIILDPCSLPNTMAQRNSANLADSIESGIRQFLDAMAVLSVTGNPSRNKDQITPIDAVPDQVAVEKAWAQLAKDVLEVGGWKEKEGFKDLALIPSSYGKETIEKSQLLDFVHENEIRLANYGGGPFPFPHYYPGSKNTRRKTGLTISYAREDSSFRDWDFEAWSLYVDGMFLARSSVGEDHLRDRRYPKGKLLSYFWILKDICRPLSFANAMISVYPSLAPIVAHFKWSGMKGRQLTFFDSFNRDFSKDYICSQEEITFSTRVEPGTDLVANGTSCAIEVFWLFGWDRPNKDQIQKDVSHLIRGVFPPQ